MTNYLVTLCDSCQRVALMAITGPSVGAGRCASCDDPLRVVPSCSYRHGDVEQFMELSQIVSDGGVDADDAQLLAAEIGRALAAGAYRASFDTLAVRLPGLLPLQLVTGGNLAGQRAALHKLRTIFEALATKRRSSLVQVKAPSPQAAGRLA